MSIPVTSIRPTADNPPSVAQATAAPKPSAEAVTEAGPTNLARPTPSATIQVSTQARHAAANSGVVHKHKGQHP